MQKQFSYYTVRMTTCSDLFRIIPRLMTGSLLVLLVSGLVGCDQAPLSSGSPSSSAPAGTSRPQPATDDKLSTGPPVSAAMPESDNRPKIVAFGDSLTAGLGVSPEQTYPAQLQKQLDTLGLRYQVLNAGVSGDTTAGGLRRVSWVLAGKPSVVILELGGNDGLRGLSLPETRSHLDAMIRQLKEARVQVILAGMKLPPNYGEEYTTKFEAIYRDLAKTHALALIPFLLEGVGGDQKLNQADGIHPTGEGYRIVVQNVLQTLLPLLNASESHSPNSKKKA
ncbi:MAG: Arylesterase precursor [Nitrospira sp.]|nr:MAG: Arylesterase precursor [Nitrospira sp.]